MRYNLYNMSKTKEYGQFFTPENVVRTLVRWAVRSPKDRILDPSCGDGEFLASHPYSVGIELDANHAAVARLRAKASLVHQSDFFLWAEETHEKFEACVGNPPFIRYQGFSGEIRKRALKVAALFGADFSQLTSSWAPFIAGAASLLKPAGRLAFVVPAEIGHATYAMPLLTALARQFDAVQVVAIKHRLFPKLSEDAWLLYAEGFGGKTDCVGLTVAESFKEWERPPRMQRTVPLQDLVVAGRLRRWLLPDHIRRAYGQIARSPDVYRIGSIADIGIGYVTGGNDFFHLRSSEIRRLRIPERYLKIAVRKSEYLPSSHRLTKNHVDAWIRNDKPVFLLHLQPDERMPGSIRRYLSSDEAEKVKLKYKCKVRDPWYAVPGVIVPHGFLSYMSGRNAVLIKNSARCVATNSVHTVMLKNHSNFRTVQRDWSSLLAEFSREVEGHPLGGGMLKLEPGEARSVLLPKPSFNPYPDQMDSIREGLAIMREWRHCG
jgi:adenine-specific DNA-methyltransferase